MTLLEILAICTIIYSIKEIDGPFNSFSKARNYLMLNKYVGVFFYKLLSCQFCCGFWAGAIVYLLSFQFFKLNYLFLHALAGSAIGLIFYALISFLSRESKSHEA